MKTKFIFPILFLLMTSISFAQGFREKKEKVKALTTLKTEGEQLKQATLDAKKKADEFLK